MSQATCVFPGCTKQGGGKTGLCKVCQEWVRNNPGRDWSTRVFKPKVGPGPCNACGVHGKRARVYNALHLGYLCNACVKWVEKHPSQDPTERTRPRAHGTVMAELVAAANATTDECITFHNGRANGRGTVNLNGRTVNAARAVWTVAHGDPGERHVLHRCNGGSGSNGCINLRHLYLGPHARNMLDKMEAGRDGRTKLSPEQVREIRRRFVRGTRTHRIGNAKELAEEFGVHRDTIYAIGKGERYQHVE